MLSDIAIAQAHEIKPIVEIAARAGLAKHEIQRFGDYKAKVPLDIVDARPDRNPKLVLVTGVSPTAAGEGKSTTSVGLADALTLRGRNPLLCIREPSLGPVFGIKGGAAGGGYSQVVPMEDINLHFTGDFHAITSAHALLSAMLDNHLFRPNSTGLDQRRVTWGRAVDMNDRALRDVVVGLGGPFGGIPRQEGFMITAASEVMAVFCLARDLNDLKARLGNIIVGYTRDREPVRCRDIGAHVPMTILLKDAVHPNMVQTLGGTPALVHGGPFANIAHGCNTVVATRAALGLADIVVTEAGFGADLGAEKFLDIKCRQSGLRPDAVVLVCTARALKMHGGAAQEDLATPSPERVRAGTANLARHVANLQQFGLQPVVAVNRFAADTDAEIAAIEAAAAELDTEAVAATHWADGGTGATALGEAVLRRLESPAAVELLYPDAMPLPEKLRTVATRIYGAADIELAPAAAQELDTLASLGYGRLPVCIAKTQYSFSADPKALGAPSGHTLPVREVRLAAGAGFVVAICGAVMTMPGLPRRPAALDIGLDASGAVVGL